MSPRRVLVVDDSEVTRAILGRTLRSAGFEVLEARDGVQGAVLALRELPAAVITDLEMPTMDGFPLLRLLKAEPASAHIPVLILTSHGEAASRFWSRRTGADAYLTKDHQPQDLVATVERLVAAAPAPAAAFAGAAGADIGPMDILARVARQLDASLLEATLVNNLLERGMAAGDFHEAGRAALRTIGEAIDARFLAVAVGESEGVMLHVVCEQPLRRVDFERLRDLLVARVEAPPAATLDVQLSGEVADEAADEVDEPGAPGPPPLELDRAVWLPLAVREARAVLALLPRDPQQLAAVTAELLAGLAGHLALVLDNARLSQRLHELSTHDGLTRQLNHRATYDRLSEELERARRYRTPLSIVLCDLDNFKLVNDTHGHLAGDAVLRESAAVLRRCLRVGDLLGRYGGEEFLAILPQVDLDSGRLAAERLRVALEGSAVPLPGGEVAVTASFGVCEMAEISGKVTADLLVSLADRRLYEAKAAGRNRVRP
ncbi:MAG TPA: diguanylate cyclase [Thermoanaerobaculia bacterium]|nr:diguanylate cyclase [Thermoanaerobaculia bacterium]